MTRVAGVEDAGEVARLLHDFNTEFDTPSPGVEAMTRRSRRLLGDGEMTVVLTGESPPLGLAVLRFRPSLWVDSEQALDAYLEELYVVPDRRGEGLGRALMEATIDAARERGAVRMELGTSEGDVAAIALYERMGFTNLEGENGPVMFVYERDL